jgi:hypothetical protein
MQSHSEFFESLFKRNYSSPDNIEFLQGMADKYPFFVPAQFYLLAQTKTDAANYNNQAARTALLFNNEFWLNYQLEQTYKAERQQAETVIIPSPYQPVPAPPITEPENNDASPVVFQPMNMVKEEPEQAPAPILSARLASDDEPVIFQPLYTTDYFASQGIKLSEEVHPTDKLGTQLKSFTDWLKTMKKVHPDKLPAVDVQLDARIQSQAERSNTGQEVVTEAMAEVLVHQGLTRKAIEVYEKLSLLNPAKSAYFAAKITQLKEL